MQEFKLSRIAAKFGKGVWNIHQFGYDQDGKFVKKVDTYRDYFYYNSNHLDDIEDKKAFDCGDTNFYDSLNGETVNKIYYSSIKEKNNIDRAFKDRIFQSDVKPEFKYVLDNNLQWSNKRHIMYFDIETWYDPNDNTKNSPDKAQMPITSIVVYSSEKERYFVFSWHPEKTKDLAEPKIVDKGDITYVFSKTEEEAIWGFLDLLSVSNVDILTGWYSGGFDVPYIINRCKNLGIPFEKMSPVEDVYMRKRGDYWRFNIRGLDHVDMMEGLKDMGYNLPNWKLATAVKEITGDENYDKLTDVTWKNWLDDYEGFIKYAVRDVEILKEINNKIQMFDLYITMQQIANLESLSLVFFKSMIVDNYMVKEFHNKIIFPTRRTIQRRGYAGAIVIDPTEPGRHKDVTVMDYTSLYPTTIMAFNISPETFITSEEECQKLKINFEDVKAELIKDGIPIIDTGYQDDLFGKRYLFYSHKHKLGLMPFILKKLFLKRVEINDNLKAGAYEGDMAVAMKKRQWAFKLILNSAYGAMGFNYFRLCSYECADAITFFARQALKYAIVDFSSRGHKTLYGDTDSIFVKSEGKDENHMNIELEGFNKNLENNFVKKYNPEVDLDYHHMDLKFEYDLEYAYFSEVKKRYYTIIRNTGEKYIRGLNIIRKDTPEFLKDKLNDMAELAVRDQLDTTWVKDLRNILEEQPYEKLGISKAFGKPFKEYNKTMPQHVKAARWANDKLGTEITHQDNPYLFYIKSNCEDSLKVKERQKAICLNSEDLKYIDARKDVFEIDYDVYFKKQVLEQLDEFKHIDKIKILLENDEFKK